MNVSIILCTYNRCQSLKRALDSVAASKIPESIRWQVLVLDNNSRMKLGRLQAHSAIAIADHFRYVFEPQQGKSFALNRGIREATGDVLAFIDDDITVEPSWLYELTKPLLNGQCAGAGGRVFLPKDLSLPPWIATEGRYSLLSILANFDLGPELQVLSTPPIGNNMAFHKEVFDKYGLFRTDLGPTPGNEIRQEDTELGWRVIRGGEKLLYVPTAIVRHAVEENRLKKEYFLAYHFDYGRALIREKGSRGKIGIFPRSIVSLLNRMLNIFPKKIWWWIRETDAKKRFFNKCHAWAMAGEITELYRSLFVRATHSKQPVPGEDDRTVSA